MAKRSLTYYGRSYLRVARRFRNGIALAYAHHYGVDRDRATLWNGMVVRNPPGRGGLAETVVEVWGQEVYRGDDFYRPQANHIVLDIGANVGLFSIWLAYQAPGIDVLAFEPFAENFGLLQQNVQPWPAIRVYPYAVGGQHGTASMRAVGARSLDHQVDSSTDGDVTVITLTEAIDLAGSNASVELLKMDIEGSEYDVFRQPQPPDLMRRIRKIVIEWHEHVRPGVLSLIKERLAPTHEIVSVVADDPRYGLLYASRRDAVSRF